VEVASTGAEALSKISAGNWDLLVSDLRMPGGGGAELFGRLRVEHPELERRVLFITGDAAGDKVKQFVEKSGRKHLVKPFGLAELERLAIEVLEAADRPFRETRTV
jgi:CheY-like chemotaxis protein